MIPTGKRCPYCNTTQLIDPFLPPEKCASCGNIPVIKIRLSDTDRTRGGFTLEKQFTENEFPNQLLEFIFKNPDLSVTNIARGIRKPRSTVSHHVKNLMNEGMVIGLHGRKYRVIRCSDKYIPPVIKTETLLPCMKCGKKVNVSSLKRGKCESCVAQQKLIRETFNRLSAEAEKNINAMQRCKNMVQA